MKTVWLLLRAFGANGKNRRNIGFVIVLIVVIISTICYVRQQEPDVTESGKIVLGVAKEDTSEYTDLLLRYFNENEIFLHYVELIEAEELQLHNAMEQGKLDAYLVIPENFAQSMIAMENMPIRAGISTSNPTKALVLRHVMEAYENYIEAVEVNCTALYRLMKEEGFSSKELDEANVEISLDLIFTALGKDDFFRYRMVETEEKATLSLAEHYKYSAVYFVLLFLFLPAGLQLISIQKNGLLRRFRAVNVSTGAVFAAISIPYLIISITMLAVVCFMEKNQDRLIPAVLFSIPWVVIFLILGRICGENKRYLFVCSMILICLAIFGGSLIPEEFLPESFQTIAGWMPNRNFTYVMGGVQP